MRTAWRAGWFWRLRLVAAWAVLLIGAAFIGFGILGGNSKFSRATYGPSQSSASGSSTCTIHVFWIERGIVAVMWMDGPWAPAKDQWRPGNPEGAISTYDLFDYIFAWFSPPRWRPMYRTVSPGLGMPAVSILAVPAWTLGVVCVLLVVPFAWRVWRTRRRVQAGRCVECGYDLAGLPADAACPECGTDRTGPDAADNRDAARAASE